MRDPHKVLILYLFFPHLTFHKFPFFSPFKFEEMNSEMEESRELADNRLIELQKLQQDLQNVHQENNSMKVGLCFSHTILWTFIWKQPINTLWYSMNYGGTPSF